MSEPPPPPLLSVVMPVFNEAGIIESVVPQLRHDLEPLVESFEIIIAENGSTDGSQEIADRIASACPQVKALHLNRADYGAAIKQGLIDARGRYIFQCSVDFIDLDFLRSALSLTDRYDVVLGSKYLTHGTDTRSWFRRAAGRANAGILRVLFSLPVTDTHGIKLFKRAALAAHPGECRFGGAMFDTELILRLSQAGLQMIEIPLACRELRPSRRSIFAVAFGSLVDSIRLAVLRVKERRQS